MRTAAYSLWFKSLVVAGTLQAFTAGAEIPRMPDGKPDFSGVYDTGTLTPLNRPKEFGEKKFMTREEADKVTKAMLGRFEFANRESDPNRGAPKKGGDGNNTAGAGGVGGYNAFWIDPGNKTFEIDGKFRTSIVYAPANGRQPPLTKAAQQRMATSFAGSPTRDLVRLMALKAWPRQSAALSVSPPPCRHYRACTITTNALCRPTIT